MLKVEIDKIQDKYLEILFKIIKALESSVETETSKQINPPKSDECDAELKWPGFIKKTYGCLADDPIKRGDQGKYEIREE